MRVRGGGGELKANQITQGSGGGLCRGRRVVLTWSNSWVGGVGCVGVGVLFFMSIINIRRRRGVVFD